MLNSISRLTGSKVTATDGDIGHVKEAFFDDRDWAIRYLVVDAGTWMKDRDVLISPYSVKQPVGLVGQIHVSLTRKQVKDSPDVDTHQPVSRQHERNVLRYYSYPEYWDGGGRWAAGATPYLPTMGQLYAEQADRQTLKDEFKAADVHLRSSDKVSGYGIQAINDSIGEVQDFIFDDENWAIRYLVVDTRTWWPGGHKVLIGMQWADRIDWSTRKIHVHLTREEVKDSPPLEDLGFIHRDYEERLHRNYARKGYWA